VKNKFIENKKKEKEFTYFLLQLFSHHVQDQMFESKLQFQHQLSEIRNEFKIRN
jgi:hypothetical protein